VQVTLPEFQAHLSTSEGCIPFLYLDTRGFVTCAIGHRVPSLAACHSLSWQNPDGTQAVQNTVTLSWLQVCALPKGLVASAYETACVVRLPASAIAALFASDTQEKDRQLREAFPDFDRYPSDAQFALRDMAFNLGVNGLIMKFPHLRQAVLQQDWSTAAGECRRAGISEERNDWTRRMFVQSTATL